MEDILLTRQFENLIFELRGFKVMIDMDLAALYETETKRLKEQIKRNPGRFPSDLMFQLTNEEKEQLVANCDRLANLKYSSITWWKGLRGDYAFSFTQKAQRNSRRVSQSWVPYFLL